MRPHAVAAVVLLAFSHGADARSGNDTSAGGVGIPKCAIPCAIKMLGDQCLGLDLKNKSCGCFKEAEATKYALCVRMTCPVADALTTARLTKIACGYPVRDLGRQYTIQQYVFMTLSGLAVVLRLLSKILPGGDSGQSATLGVDDLCVALAYVFLVPTIHINAALMVGAGLGRDIWTLSLAQLRVYGYYFYLSEPLYFVVTGLVRLAFLAFFLRVFGTKGTACTIFKRWSFAMVVKVTIVLSLMAMVAFTIAVVFQCTPISYFWKRFDGVSRGTCINSVLLINLNSALSIFMDLWILYLPLSQISLLNMPRRRKLQLALMFSVGFIATVVAVLRMQTFYALNSSMNMTWDSYPLVAWSSLEMHAGIICVCMPAMRIFCRSGISMDSKPVVTVFGSDAEDTTPPDPLRSVHPGTEYIPGAFAGKPDSRRLTPNFFAVSYKGGRV
ncbi:hypothetical protein MAPG_04914 [Magnaporthiopsis poae ATCC 64411]|uniref:Uncharacterized protein n=1 Tax=Magnaporthiopsis poae (strain ATCC 64411 / 73-15) TaxID=644358 RepID=A0A0C4DY04_MAGP6|nr:hypothetical protein MAPG_04914 [Magnaporthiopsis poae ATCC 64411]